MNAAELRYLVFKALADKPQEVAARLNSPVPGEPVSIGVVTASGENRWFRVTVEETDGPDA